MRYDGRQKMELRPVEIETGYIKHPEGSVLITVGETKVICNASIEDRVPPFMRNSGKGWITAETPCFRARPIHEEYQGIIQGKISGRTMEIQRLIGRPCVPSWTWKHSGNARIWIDCDVIQADGGTRTASITGAFVAMALCPRKTSGSEQNQQLPAQELPRRLPASGSWKSMGQCSI